MQKVSFALETTLAGRSHAVWIEDLRRQGYECHIAFIWPRNPEVALSRVRQRAAAGGHSIPDHVIVRRYWRGIRNFDRVYRQLAASWVLYDNGEEGEPRLVARGKGEEVTFVARAGLWKLFLDQATKQC